MIGWKTMEISKPAISRKMMTKKICAGEFWKTFSRMRKHGFTKDLPALPTPESFRVYISLLVIIRFFSFNLELITPNRMISYTYYNVTGFLLNIILIFSKVHVDMCKTTHFLVPDIQTTIHTTWTVLIGSTFHTARICKFTLTFS